MTQHDGNMTTIAPQATTVCDPLRILFIAPAPMAGTIQYTHNLANALAQRGHRVVLATGIGFELHRYPKRYEAREVFDRFTPHPIRLSRFLWEYMTLRPHIVHFQGAQSPLMYIALWAILSLLRSTTFVYTPQDVLPNSLRGYHMAALRFFYDRMRHIYLNAKQNEALVLEHFHVPSHRITVLPIADLTAFIREADEKVTPPLPVGRKIVLCFGLIEPRKGIATLLDAATEVARQVPEALILIVGKPLMDLSSCEHTITTRNLRDHVRLLPGYVSFAEMAGYFAVAHFLVLPYESGWNSGVLASAFGFGKPVVATRVGGFDEVITHEVNGLLVPPKDSASLAFALIRMLQDEALYERLLEQVRQTAAGISWNTIAGKTEQTYFEVSVRGDCAVPQVR